ncbi:phosphotransferase family protein [Cellulomonas fimi]|uniref:Aminoglycoside phosphotransferase n=1 Tax=Cellulomonas fimi (strain ATCC 484 / DSM 20113 / JCM 1341 / CCUG 24087 / LMG 16345 / NBRC 15513 / NCIMB 8980 / NCTC 7547 / NRS-133) TaxID=590998 RepID=F4H627_CELFA|nr:phosphotransferase family protein [Cellulomonas fimi]AEE46757.1 aminoglycoside phosphotransferase [Cellulomonas fimi ATCC 484]VEH34098.1 thiamine kinase [Cellulomonas fimi]
MAPQTLPGLDVARLDGWLRTHRPDLAGDGPLAATLLTGGRSNLTYRVDGARVPLVLRRPPLHHVQATAHDMAREHRVLTALGPTPVPVPGTHVLVDDTDGAAGTGTAFFLMDRVDGEALGTRAHNAHRTPAALRTVSLTLAALLAELHLVDADAAGLGDLGRADGFLDRQVHRWGVQLDGSRSRAVPALDDLQDRLRERVPTTWRAAVVHGDYRLDNVLVAGTDEPRVTAVLDWEMATLGDAAVDLGMLGLYWELGRVAGDDPTVSAVDPGAGYPPFDELVDAYAQRLGAPPPDLGWYRAFAAYKLAVILEGVHFRYRAGGTVGDGFERIGGLVDPLAREGLALLAARTTGRG